MMSIKIKPYLLLLPLLLIVSSCAYDNYEKPQSMLSGKVIYNGQPVHVASQQVTFRLFQKGFERRVPITVQVASDGSYHALLFDGTYQIIFPSGQGPFIQNTETDTLKVVVRGDTKQNIRVKPYYWIKNPKFSIEDRTVSVSFGLKKVIINSTKAKDLQSISLYVNTTRFANLQNNISSQTITGGELKDLNNIHLSAHVPQLTIKQGNVFAHIAVKIENEGDRLYSKIVKLKLE